ncbi:transglutaminase-like domain-containing protein [Myxococcus sp. K15C18031901]|uniref:transglutaminase-like domain-containing protein n=1 Tax=Myxococcus dinghuensis TaxID=2906761 RepID=UPI0020A7E275|nr:transglutaminase-like domain-containing protein [Myxococcus dinghuensis]MCP3104049.1 transglutaminase-like domain-containing protein [Myxococcus dinghuensis]
MTRTPRPMSLALVSLCALLVGASSALAAAPAATAELSDAVKAPRPKGGEYFGLYLMDKKVGWLFTDLEPLPGDPTKVKVTNQLTFKALVGTRLSERTHREERIYEAKPQGRLLSFTVVQRGDGGDQELHGAATPDGVSVVRKRVGHADETLPKQPPAKEHVEDADQARVALLRKAKVEGFSLDGMDLETYGMATTVEPAEQRTLNGVKVKLAKASTLSQKEKVPVVSYVTQRGDMVLVEFGQTMQARKETEAVAKRMDLVEVFGLTRVVLPKPLPESARAVPGTVKLLVQGLPEKFRVDSYRQKYEAQPDGSVEVTLLANAPSAANRKPRPLADPEGGENLKSTLMVESDTPVIREQSKKIVGDEKDAYRAAQKVNTWVATHLEKDYGASADRATDVLRQKRGDCTEHSLLSVALLRAAGIPARRVDGVIYMVNQDGVPALYWHEWVEAFVGEWTQLDPTFNQPVADATHFAFGREGNAEITPLIGTLKVTEVR